MWGGLSGPPKAHILGRLVWMARARISRENGLFLGNTRFLWWIKVEVYLYTPLFLEKYAFSVVDKRLVSRKIVFWRSGSFRNTRILDKMGCLEGWGAYFSRKRLVWMARACISRENGLSGWLGRIFLEKKACLDGWDAYFS